MTVSGQSCNQEVEKAGREQADALLDGFSEEEKNQLRDIQEQFLVYQTTNRSVAENMEKEFLVKKMFHYLRPYRFLAIVSPLMMVGEVTADLLLPFLMSFIVNYGITGMELTDPVHGSQTAIAIMEFFHGAFYTRMELIVTFGILMLVITLIGGLFGVLCAYTAARAAQGMGYDLRRDAYRKVMSFSIEQTDQFTTGSLITRMTNDITMVVDFFEMLMRGFVRSPMFLIGGTAMLLMLDLKFTAILLCGIPVMAVVLVTVLGRAIPLYSLIQKKMDNVNNMMQENVTGARVVKAYVQEDYECNRFDIANRELTDVNYTVAKLMAVISPVLTVLLNLAIVAIIYIGGLNIRIENAGMTTGSIMAAITYMTQVLNALMMVTNVFQQISRASASAKRVNEILETEPVVVGGTEADILERTAI